MKQRLLTILLTLLPLMASADESGTCGDNLTWTFEQSTGTLSILGTGNMTNYWSQEDTPWYSFQDKILKGFIDNGVTSIGKCAFSGCKSIVSLNIPNSVTDIGERAFQNCSGLISVTIGSSVTKIRHNAFNGCSSLISITIPNNVTSLGDYAFAYCSGLTSVTIGSGVTGIGQKAFYLCSNLTSVHISDIAAWCMISFYEQSSNPLSYAHHLYLSNEEIKDLIIPNTATFIRPDAFNGCSGLNSVIIPNSVTDIGQYAFANCSGLTSVSIPESVTFIRKYVFKGCTSLTSVSIPESVTSIGEYSFSGCSSLTNTNIPNGVTTISKGTFEGCSSLTSIIIPEGVTTIDDGAFNSSGLTSVSIPKNVTSIGDYVFNNCDNLTSLEFHCKEIGASINRLKSLKKIIIGKEVATIDNSAFYDCSSLTSVHISDLAAWCKISFKSNPLSLAHNLFLNGEEIKDLVIPENITSISSWAFRDCSSLLSVTISDGVSSIGSRAFEGCSNLTSVTLGNNVNSVIDFTFAYCNNLTSFTFGNSVISIGNYAFYGCSNLTSVNFPNTLKTIRERAFKDCSQLESIIIPADVEVIYQEAFSGCSSLEMINALPTTPPILYDNSFSDYSVPVKVPKGCKEAYQTAQGWKNFTNISDADKYKLIYIVDGEEYKSFEIEEGGTITPETEPTKEGYTFSGWSDIPETMPGKDVTVIGTFTVNKYKLTYSVDGEEYKSYDIEYGTTITSETEPTKEGYTFGGWSDIPKTMPAKDVNVTGTFTVNKYKLTYIVDGEEYKSYDIEYGSTITSETEPTKEGYTFSGWSDISETMPAKDVTVTGTFTVNKYKLTYSVDGEEYKSYEIEYGSTITSETEPTKEGYTFSGWSDIPETMPAKDVTVTGTFTINKYKVTYMIDGEVYQTVEVEYGSTITPPNPGDREGYDFAWGDYPSTMPAEDIIINGSYTATDIKAVLADESDVKIYTVSGKPLNNLQKGVNILRYKDGRTQKLIIK